MKFSFSFPISRRSPPTSENFLLSKQVTDSAPAFLRLFFFGTTEALSLFCWQCVSLWTFHAATFISFSSFVSESLFFCSQLELFTFHPNLDFRASRSVQSSFSQKKPRDEFAIFFVVDCVFQWFIFFGRTEPLGTSPSPFDFTVLFSETLSPALCNSFLESLNPPLLPPLVLVDPQVSQNFPGPSFICLQGFTFNFSR